jgi:hypothetical protein
MKKEELHELVEEYCRDFIGEMSVAQIIHEEIDEVFKRDIHFELFEEWAENK